MGCSALCEEEMDNTNQEIKNKIEENEVDKITIKKGISKEKKKEENKEKKDTKKDKNKENKK